MFLSQKGTRIIKLKIIIFFLILLTQQSFSYELKYVPFVKQNIEIKLSNKNLKKFHEFLSEINLNKVKSRDEKKWIKAKIIYDGNEFKGQIRINGSPTTMDHIDFKRGITSFHVKLFDGSIGGIKYFRLLLPRTKNYENEIFWSLLMETLNYPTPYTSLVNLKFNKLNFQMIFQEKTEKEFLLRWGLKDMPIIEGNTSYWMKKRVKCMKLNKNNFDNCFNKNISDFVESYKIENNSFIKKNNYNESFQAILSQNYYFQKQFEELNEPYGLHGLSFKNSKFFYDPDYNHKISIYFDGDIKFDNFDKNNCVSSLFNTSEIFQKKFQLRASTKLSKKFKCIASYYLSRKDLYFKKPKFTDINTNYSFNSFNFKNNKNLQYLIYNDKLKSFQICKPNLYCENISFKFAKKIFSGSHSIYKKNNIQKLVLPVEENKFKKTVDKIIVNNKTSNIDTNKDSLTYIKFEDHIKNANLSVVFKNNSKIYISNSKLNYLQLKIVPENIIYESDNYNHLNLIFLDSEVKNFELISSHNLDDKKIKLIRSNITFKN